jgi:hypothetical protein
VTRDGQTMTDYGAHYPSPDWHTLPTCRRCHAEPGTPCYDLRHRRPLPYQFNHQPHRERRPAPNRKRGRSEAGAGGQ